MFARLGKKDSSFCWSLFSYSHPPPAASSLINPGQNSLGQYNSFLYLQQEHYGKFVWQSPVI